MSFQIQALFFLILEIFMDKRNLTDLFKILFTNLHKIIISGGANIFPGLFVDLYNASPDRDLKKIAVLRDKGMMIELERIMN